MIQEYIVMNNSKSFIALAFIREVENPYEIFCNYIEYCLYMAKYNSLTYDELLMSFKENSGLNIPNYIFSHCLKIMLSDNTITKIANRTKYKLINRSIDINDFESRKRGLENQEDVLIKDLISYVSNEFNKDWDYKKAQTCITNFLLLDDNTYSVFTDSDIVDVYSENSDEWIIKSYIRNLKESDSLYYKYLLDITNGLVTYIGVLYTNPNDNTIVIEDTDFYLDTKLILRFLGYTTEIYHESIVQLVNIVRDTYNGNVCVFKHTVSEVRSALYNAHTTLDKGQEIEDNELRMYQKINNISSDDFKVDSDSVEEELTSNNIRIQEKIEWDDTSCWINHINEQLLFDEIKKHRKIFKKISIDNDVNAINQINMLRNGNYSVHFGGENKLPIIVTNNTLLIKNIKDFILKDIEEDSNSVWKISKMPIISDTALMCKLWSHSNQKKINIPELIFSKNAHSILSYDDMFFSNLRERSSQLKSKYRCKVFNLSNERMEKVEKLIIKNYNGNIEELSDDELIYTIEESYKVDKIALENRVAAQNDIIKIKDEIIEDDKIKLINNERKLIVAYSQKYLDKFGANILFILFAKYWWILSTIIIAIISYFGLPKINVNKEENIFIGSIVSLAPLLYRIIIEISKKVSSKKEVVDFIDRRCMKIAKEKYTRRIKKRMPFEEKEYEEQIIKYCIEESKYFKKDTD